jgi:SAM-dependent methyltransferase
MLQVAKRREIAVDVVAYNRQAWDRQVAEGNPWTVPVTPEVIAAARAGHWRVVLTAVKQVPPDWFPPLAGLELLGMACGGGQQCPVFAAAGASVTVLDNSPAQLSRDREVAQREGLKLRTVEGDMADLSTFADESFDVVFHPVSNVFAAAVRPVYREAARVLRRGGILMAGFMNPDIYIFDRDAIDRRGVLRVKYELPYTDAQDLPPRELQAMIDEGWPLEHSHSLEDQIGGQCDAGLQVTRFYEDHDAPESGNILSRYMPCFYATRSVKA